MGLYNYFLADRPPKKKREVPPPLPLRPRRGLWAENLAAHALDIDDFDFNLPPSTFGSSRNSISGHSTRSRSSSLFVDDIKHEVMVNYLYQQQCSRLWVSEGTGELEGVLLRRTRGAYRACPPALSHSTLAMACTALNIQCAMTVNSRVIRTFLSWSPEAVDVPLMNGLRIQIVPTIDDLARARKHHFAAFVASEAMLVVWDDDALHLVQRAAAIESELMELVWKTGRVKEGSDEKKPGTVVRESEVDEESGRVNLEKRPVHLLNACLISMVIILVVLTLGAAWRQLAIEITVDGNYARLGLVCLLLIQVFFSLFFAQVMVGCLAQMFGPIRQLTVNSKYFSAIPPPRLRTPTLPHVTVQCPVYKEGLQAVIQPTVRSIKQAISTYELQGGSANLFINDDGLQLISEEERQARIDFYSDNSIGWVARPKHGENGFQRRGKFKKASNMNFALMISCKVEEKLSVYDRGPDWSQTDEAIAYEKALKDVLEEDGRAWADGNIRVGDYILIVDSDTRVPSDCLLDSVSEMDQSPEVGILQFSSGVMQVVHTYFENGITFFTNLIYSAIRYTVANGDVAPFVGHNAILRWSAIQQVAYEDEDGYEKYWSESHVSEDFDMSLRLQCDGYIVRLAAWAGDEFKEGVSLTVYDELARWEKYAYGCNELLFHPIRKWPWEGPFTPLFRRFLGSSIRLTSKVTILSYIGTYYAIGAAWIMTSANYFIMGWFNGYLDKYYIDSWQVWFSIIIVFNGLGNVALAIMRYRVGERTLGYALYENFKWTFLLAIFLGGLSLHLSQALVCHMLEIDMSWGATSKEAEFSNFFIEVPKVIKKFKFSMIFSLVFLVAMIIIAVAPFVPNNWRITDFVAILPMATVASSHFLLPLALNPALMTFSW
ncbi:glycosyl transferase family group 2-domain-containing protein [Hypoxylon trugodes]|uniref:glycosyl transferase family group 2-domain-containing protein n=1 Tax=Hypoxylon trugodes TaxID=326681 RepID=UPI00219F9758|nr:glycosyl transferase family group 2-domain-containing protein [Hypoxylon trugodes]KAI1392627.1 glycosyl transferase family group 2-domain-containing protein [Hypoxylon trugodes]